jgi:hypothetical protein
MCPLSGQPLAAASLGSSERLSKAGFIAVEAVGRLRLLGVAIGLERTVC